VIREGRQGAVFAVEGDGAAEHCQGIEHREGEFSRGYGAIPTNGNERVAACNVLGVNEWEQR
jgi:hypothetical protein